MFPCTKASAVALVGAGLALTVAMTTGGPVLAQDATYISPSASYCDLYRGLSKLIPNHCATTEELNAAGETGAPQVRTRGIRFNTEPSTGPREEALAPGSGAPSATGEPEVETAYVPQAAPPETLEIAMRVQFQFDSFRLTDEARQVLDGVAAVLRDPGMQDKVIEIEGHADAHGPDGYNLQLSQLRARSVRAYLIEEHGIEADRLNSVGRGELEPYEPADPFNWINRRVEFHNVTG